MAGALILRNGYTVCPGGWAFRYLVSEVAARLNPVQDQDICRLINDPSGVVDVLDYLDLRNRTEWSESAAERFEAVLKQTYHDLAHHDDWRVVTTSSGTRDQAFRCLAKLVEIGLERHGIAQHTVEGGSGQTPPESGRISPREGS